MLGGDWVQVTFESRDDPRPSSWPAEPRGARRGLGEAARSWCAESLAVDEHVGLPNGTSSPLLADAASAVVRSARAYTPVLDSRLLDDNLPTRRDSTIDVLLSTVVGMLQAPIGTTRVRASGVLSHPLASERGELPLLGPRHMEYDGHSGRGDARADGGRAI